MLFLRVPFPFVSMEVDPDVQFPVQCRKDEFEDHLHFPSSSFNRFAAVADRECFCTVLAFMLS